MSSLLESPVLHHRVRTLSSKARETEVHEQDPPNRRLPARDHTTPPMNSYSGCTELSNRQRGQQRHRKKEREVRLNQIHEESANVSVPFRDLVVSGNAYERSIAPQRPQRGQQQRRQRERMQTNPHGSAHGNRSRLVSTHLITHIGLR